jgi:divalent metal cation (Fe/Co/Zn/Cd) transporter
MGHEERALPEQFPDALARSAYRVSLASVVFSFITSTLAIAIGLGSSVVLVAFGAVGFVDAFGSVALTYHFRHALHHEAISERFEQLAHRAVRIGLAVVGIATVAVSIVRLVTGDSSAPPAGGGVLAAVSLVVLAVLSSQKRRLGREIGSKALLADGRVSGIGGVQAGIALAGLVASRAFDAGWADAAAALVVGAAAVLVAVVDPD